ncbi:hypothetical protein K438DRAFT_1988016 [Mycena galopus ATCC 62051]|nr:hypothetical protein K438DRAFT_1988016 [Mycena galopus ATCC 62051]
MLTRAQRRSVYCPPAIFSGSCCDCAGALCASRGTRWSVVKALLAGVDDRGGVGGNNEEEVYEGGEGRAWTCDGDRWWVGEDRVRIIKAPENVSLRSPIIFFLSNYPSPVPTPPRCCLAFTPRAQDYCSSSSCSSVSCPPISLVTARLRPRRGTHHRAAARAGAAEALDTTDASFDAHAAFVNIVHTASPIPAVLACNVGLLRERLRYTTTATPMWMRIRLSCLCYGYSRCTHPCIPTFCYPIALYRCSEAMLQRALG